MSCSVVGVAEGASDGVADDLLGAGGALGNGRAEDDEGAGDWPNACAIIKNKTPIPAGQIRRNICEPSILSGHCAQSNIASVLAPLEMDAGNGFVGPGARRLDG